MSKALLETRLRDALNRLVNLAVGRADEPLPSLLFQTAEFLFFENLARVVCAFELDGELQTTCWPAGDPPAAPAFDDDHRIALYGVDGTQRWVVIRPDLDRRTQGEGRDGMRWLGFEIDGVLDPDEVALFDHLCRWTEWQTQLVALVEALWLRRRPDERQAVVDFDRVVAKLEDIAGGAHSLSHKLEAIVEQLDTFEAQTPAPTREFRARWAREAAEWAVQALHGSGWAQRPLDAGEAYERCLILADRLNRLAQAPRVGWTTAFKLRCLAVAVGVGQGQLPPPPQEPNGEYAHWWLLAAWTRKHGRARRRAEAFGQGELDLGEFWVGLLARTQQALQAHLSQAARAGALSPDWLRGWLLLELLEPLAAALEDPAEVHTGTWGLLADFAFVAREELRRLLFGARPDFRVQPDAMRASLAHLVTFHARVRLGLPEGLDLRQLLTRLAEPRGGADGDPFAAGHLDHALYVYLAGLVALDLRFERDGHPPVTLRELLTTDLGAEAEQALPQQFALAALFHDVGVQLAPRTLQPIKGLVPDADLARLRPPPAAAEADDIVRACLRDLQSAYDEQEPLHEWLLRRPAADPYTHEVLGAWTLARRASWVPELPAEVLRAALRAILLHRAFTVPLAPKQEPVAWLLVLCDELVDWDPYVLDRRLGAPQGRTPRVMGGNLQPHRSRARSARIEGTRAQVVGGRLALTLPLTPHAPRLRVSVRLRADIGLAGRSQLVWLAAAQNLERLEALTVGTDARAVAVGPSVTFEMGLAGWRRDVGFDTRTLLREALPRFDHPARAAIHRWLVSADGRVTVEDGVERVRFEPAGHLLWTEDLRRTFDPLARLCDTLLSERALLAQRASG